jgi:hypothetical protein
MSHAASLFTSSMLLDRGQPGSQLKFVAGVPKREEPDQPVRGGLKDANNTVQMVTTVTAAMARLIAGGPGRLDRIPRVRGRYGGRD